MARARVYPVRNYMLPCFECLPVDAVVVDLILP